jgi:hypothetical protein
VTFFTLLADKPLSPDCFEWIAASFTKLKKNYPISIRPGKNFRRAEAFIHGMNANVRLHEEHIVQKDLKFFIQKR